MTMFPKDTNGDGTNGDGTCLVFGSSGPYLLNKSIFEWALWLRKSEKVPSPFVPSPFVFFQYVINMPCSLCLSGSCNERMNEVTCAAEADASVGKQATHTSLTTQRGPNKPPGFDRDTVPTTAVGKIHQFGLQGCGV